jgi:hypothetical protein
VFLEYSLEVSKDLNRLHSVSLLLQRENGNVNPIEPSNIFDHPKSIPLPDFEVLKK